MPVDFDRSQIRDYLSGFDFSPLFIEALGWDHCDVRLSFDIEGSEYRLHGIAEKRSLIAFVCEPCADGTIPNRQILLTLDRLVSKLHFEHLIICHDAAHTKQRWLWIKRERGKQPIIRERLYSIDQSGEPLVQALAVLATTLNEEENLTLTDMTGKVKAAFDVDKVTKRFYDRFKKEHDAFLAFIEGVPDNDMERWYASVMINRLMFIYFIQKKGFLDGDVDYLRNRLGTNSGDFYRSFLRPLFFEGFAKQTKERSAEMNRLLGDIPYLNGGIFLPHSIEERYGDDINIPDDAFRSLFGFFDQYRWHLDERPLREDKEINPDVLGYIFEKYINQKQMGAYYTKEDITEYIGKNTIIPRIFDMAREKCRIAFEGDHTVWDLLREDPDRYIYDAVKHGISVDIHSEPPSPLDAPLPLPSDIEAGIADVAKRTGWNTSAPPDYALPTEIWREVVARRQRYDEVRSKLESGEVRNINDLITLNLDIRQFAQDVIAHTDSSDFVRAFYDAIERITVLDPTCGSGAFLFAALTILEPLYEACLDRMRLFVDELDASGDKHSPKKFSDFRATLTHIGKHPTPNYFIYKSIILNNLYGVDIMEEAVEICKLRLFLKLVAQVHSSEDIEPLPDIDFNIKAGNTLVGFATYEDVQKAVTSKLDFDNAMEKIEKKAEEIDLISQMFREQQETLGGFICKEDKADLLAQLQELEDELNVYLAEEYSITNSRSEAFSHWLSTHKPFHWFIEFYGIMKQGGFDVIIGNPPYVEYTKVKDEYTLFSYETESCGNLYAFIIERNTILVKKNGWSGMIVPHSSICTDRMEPIQKLFKEKSANTWFSTYGIRPSKLFNGVDQRLGIYIAFHIEKPIHMHVSRYHRWYEKLRPTLLRQIQYGNLPHLRFINSFPKICSKLESDLFEKIIQFMPLYNSFCNVSTNNIFFHNAPRYWIRAMNSVPFFWNERDGEQLSTQIKTLLFNDCKESSIVTSIINSTLFYWWFIILSDCRHLNMREIEFFPIGLDIMDEENKEMLLLLTDELMKDFESHKTRKECTYKTTGKVIYDEYYPKYSKPIIDEIDRVLASHYGFTDEELDFIINYDIKYRMGDELGNE